MAPPRRAMALAGLGAVPILVIIALVLAMTPANAESIDVYEFDTLEATHGAEAVAVRADGAEALVLTSLRNDTTGLYDNFVYATSGTSLTELAKWSDQVWRWTCAAFDPASQMALLGGSRGMLFRYDQGSVSQLTSSISYDFTVIDWHPTSHEAYLGVTTSRLYKWKSNSL